MNRTVNVGCLFLVLVSSTFAAAEEKKPALRKFSDGPLRIEEFQGKPDLAINGDAYTASRVEFKYEFAAEQKNGQVEVRLTKFEVFSVFLPKSSWWKSSAKKSLLDHEQGHFDIAETAARRIQLGFDKIFASKKTIRGSGPTREKAIKQLTEKLRRVVELANEQVDQENLDYDSRTSHGMSPRNQAEHRRVQKATLDRLAKELKSVRKGGGKLKASK